MTEQMAASAEPSCSLAKHSLVKWGLGIVSCGLVNITGHTSEHTGHG